MIFIALGANLPPSTSESAVDTLNRVIQELTEHKKLDVVEVSPWYESAPVPMSDQPWFVNGVAHIRTELSPKDLLALLHDLEEKHGRVRRERNAARTLDLDLLAYHDKASSGSEPGMPILPHPRMCERAFVLLPLWDLAPDWVHPLSGRGLRDLLTELTPGQIIRRLSN